MTIEDIITLTKAGFTKDEILKLSSASVSSIAPAPEQPAVPTPQPAADPEPAAAPEAPEAPAAEDLSAVIEKKITEAFEPFKDLYNNIAIKANMPTIGNIEPKGIDDIVNDFFTK